MSRLEELKNILNDLVEEINHYCLLYVKAYSPINKAVMQDQIVYLRNKRDKIEKLIMEEIG